MDASVKLQDGLHFTGTTDSEFSVKLDANADVGGQGKGSQPMELMLISLAGCTAMDVISILRKKRQTVTDFEVHVHGQQATEHPKVFTDIEVEYIVHGKDIDPKAVERAIELSETKYCPAQAMLAEVVPIRHDYRIVED